MTDASRARVVALAVVVLLVGVAGWGFQRVFEAAGLVPVVVVASVVPVLLSGLVRSRPLWLSLILHLVVWVFVVSATLFRETSLAGFVPTPVTLTAIASGLADAPRALLATILPAPPDGRLLILVHALEWLAALTGAELVLRSRARLLPVLPAVVVFAVALLVGVDGPGSNLATAAAMLALIALLLSARAGRPLAWMAAGVPVAAVLAALAVLVAPLLPIAPEPYNPRSHVEQPPPARFDSVSPLDRISAWLQIPDTPLFSVAAAKAENWRLAVLDRYDGVRWTSGGRFQATGGRIPSSSNERRYDTVGQTVTLNRLPGRWLPAADRPTSVSGIKAVVDPLTGSLMAAAEPAKGLSYQITSHIPQYGKAELRAAVPAEGDGAALALPEGPKLEKFVKLAQEATRGARLPFQQAVLLQSFLRSTAKYDVTAPPGHSLAGLEFFLRTSHRGTSEQFASAFAVLARALGLPSRVVVGFRPGTSSDGKYLVKSGDVLAWSEIEFDGLGWVAFDPTPPRSGAKNDHEVATAAVKERQELEKELGNATVNRPEPSTKPGKGKSDRVEGAAFPLWGIGLIAAGGLAGAYLLLVVAVPMARRRRRRRGGAEDRVLGAWRQACDDLDLREGAGGGSALTAVEVSEEAARRIGPEVTPHIVPLAQMSNFTRFAPEGVAAEVAEEAWRRSDAVRGVVRRCTPPLKRLRRRLHPRSLRS